MVCDTYVTMLSSPTGGMDGTGGDLHGIDFSQTYDCSSSSGVIKQALKTVASTSIACCGGNNGAPKSACWMPPADNSHMCATPANYVGDHVVMGTFTCDSIVASNTPLAGIDFSSTYDCSSSTFQIKSTVNSIVSAGCCGTGDGIGQRSTCWVDNSYICATPANYVNAVIDNSGPGGACDQMINRDKDYICSGHGACTAET